METKLSLIRRVPAVIADIIISFITPRRSLRCRFFICCASVGFYELARPPRGTHVKMLKCEWDQILVAACRRGHIEIARRAAAGGADHFGTALARASMNMSIKNIGWILSEHIRSRGPQQDSAVWSRYQRYQRYSYYNPIRIAMFRAANRGNVSAMKMFIEVCPERLFGRANSGTMFTLIAADDTSRWVPEVRYEMRDYVDWCP